MPSAARVILQGVPRSILVCSDDFLWRLLAETGASDAAQDAPAAQDVADGMVPDVAAD